MVRVLPSTSFYSVSSHNSCLVQLRLRQLSTLVLLISITCTPIFAIAQTNKQEKRGIKVPSGPTPSTAPMTTSNAGKRPELILQTGHTRSINAIAFSPDNRWLASGGKDNVIKIWDLTMGNILRTLYGHTSNVNALAVSPDGKLLASGSGDINDQRDLGAFTQGGVVGGSEDNTVRIWDVQTGKQLQVLRGSELPVGAVAFSSDGKVLASTGFFSNGTTSVVLWDAKTLTRRGRPLGGNDGEITSLAFDPGGQTLASAGHHGTVVLWDVETGHQLARLNGHQDGALAVAFSPDGKLLASGGEDGGEGVH